LRGCARIGALRRSITILRTPANLEFFKRAMASLLRRSFRRFSPTCAATASAASTAPIFRPHGLYNYDECNNEKSILHLLIPRSKDDLDNEQCTMFLEKRAMRNLFTVVQGAKT
jgi:hypothetical protein